MVSQLIIYLVDKAIMYVSKDFWVAAEGKHYSEIFIWHNLFTMIIKDDGLSLAMCFEEYLATV